MRVRVARRLVVFRSGRHHPAMPRSRDRGSTINVLWQPEARDLEGLFTEIRSLRDGGANGSIIGRNTFQRPHAEAIDMLDKIIAIYQGKM